MTADATQMAAQEGSGPGTQFVGQLIEVGQDAEARAEARQEDVISISRGFGAPGQSNVVVSDASVVLDASVLQDAEQVLVANDLSVADQWIGQQVEVGQSGSADAMSSQKHATLTGPGTHEASGRASSDIESDITQRGFQGGLVDGGSNEQWAGQLALVEQIADATSTVVQTGTAPSRLKGGTARASASADDIALVEQVSDQTATRGGGMGSQLVQQLVFAAQDGERARDHGAAGRRLGVPDRVERGRRHESRSRHPDGVPGGSWDVGPRRPGARAAVDRRPGRRRDVGLERWDRRQGDGGQLRRDATERRPGDRPRCCAGRGGGSDHLLLPGRAASDVVARGRAVLRRSTGHRPLPLCR